MNWTDKNGFEIKVGDFVMINNSIHVIMITKIGNKNRAIFRPLPDKNILIEYHFLTYKNAKKRGISKLTNYTPLS